MNRVPVQSKALISVGYDPAAQTLEVELSSGRVYAFTGVPEGVHTFLMRSANKGGYFNRMIRERYPFEELGGPDEPADLSDVLRRSLEDCER